MPNYPDNGPSMRMHAWAFARRVLKHHTDSLGTTLLGYFAPIAIVLIAFIIGLLMRIRTESRAAFGAHFKRVFHAFLVPSVLASILFYGCLFSWATIREIWLDHYNLVLAKGPLPRLTMSSGFNSGRASSGGLKYKWGRGPSEVLSGQE